MPLPSAQVAAQPLDRTAWRSIAALLLLFVPVSLFWATYEQQGNTIALWADQFTDRHFLGSGNPGDLVSGVQSLHDLRLHAVHRRVVARAREQTNHRPSLKLAIGCLLNAAGLSVMVAPRAWSAGGAKASWLWLFAYFVVITVGELYLSPTSLSLVTKVAPASLLSMMMGVWLVDQLRRRISRRLSRHLLVEHEQRQFFPDARAHFRDSRLSIMLLHPPAARQCCTINPAATRHIARPAMSAAASELVR